eukprot:scaffold146425_cov39-Tisochrysis_lutea.AAC.1
MAVAVQDVWRQPHHAGKPRRELGEVEPVCPLGRDPELLVCLPTWLHVLAVPHNFVLKLGEEPCVRIADKGELRPRRVARNLLHLEAR